MAIRFPVHVQPGAKVPAVGGMRAGSLMVKVRQPATDGRANEAVLGAIAAAFDVRPRAVRLIHGRGSRRKLLEVDVSQEAGAARLLELQTTL